MNTMSHVSSLIVDGAALYSFIAHQNRGVSRRNRARVDYTALLENISKVCPISEAIILVTRDERSERQQMFVDSLGDQGYSVEQVKFNSRPNTSTPLSVSVARLMGMKAGSGLVLVTNDVYLYPAMQAHVEQDGTENTAVVAFPAFALGDVWDGRLMDASKSYTGEEPLSDSPSNPKIKHLDLAAWREDIFNLL